MKTLFRAAAVASIGASIGVFFSGAALANDKALPAEKVIAAIQKAVATNPGLIREVEVEREGGRLVVEVEMIRDGIESEIKIDPEKMEVIRRLTISPPLEFQLWPKSNATILVPAAAARSTRSVACPFTNSQEPRNRMPDQSS
jgi:hypothetical protein